MNLRMLSNTLFALAIGCAGILKAVGIPEAPVGLAVFSVAGAMILSNLMKIRSIGLAGVGGLLLVYSGVVGQSLAGVVLLVIIIVLTIVAVLLMIFADLSYQPKGKNLNDV